MLQAVGGRLFDFHGALEHLRQGNSITRLAWGKRKWIYPMTTNHYPIAITDIKMSYDIPSENSSNGFACRTEQWKPTVWDIIACDWYEPAMAYFSDLQERKM